MAAMTLDHLSGGRFILGLGASGPQVVEGWYGQPYPKPLARTREYVEIVRRIVARDEPVEFHGEHYDLPLQGGTGLGKPLKSTIHPLRADDPDLPRRRGAEERRPGRRDLRRLAAAVLRAEGRRASTASCLAEGFAASGDPARPTRFEVAATVTIVPGDDVERCADVIRPFLALYAGGMGARGANFHFEVFARMGYEDVATQGPGAVPRRARRHEAAAAIPLAMVEDVALVGPPDKIRDELDRWRETCLTTILVGGPAAQLGPLAELVTG